MAMLVAWYGYRPFGGATASRPNEPRPLPLGASVLARTAPAEKGPVDGQGSAGQRCPAEWLLGRANDKRWIRCSALVGSHMLARDIFLHYSRPGAMGVEQGWWQGLTLTDHWPASAPVPTCMRMLAAMPWLSRSAPLLRVRAGMQ